MTGGVLRRRKAGALIVAALAALAVPAIALAHPLGNFTINHFAAIRIAPSLISLDVVIDRAEIPAFQERQRLDADRDGQLSAAELAGQAEAGCRALAPDLRLAVGGSRLEPGLVAAGLSLPAGAGGLATMRLVCEYEAPLATALGATTNVSFEDRSFAERIGWREIVVLGDGMTIEGATGATDGGGISGRLTAYPEDLLAQPLDQRAVTVGIVPGGPGLEPWTAGDAAPLSPPGAAPDPAPGAAPDPAPGAAPDPAPDPAIAIGSGIVPGGVAEDLAALVEVTDLSPLAILVSLAVAFGLGIVHALSPGHGKTIMAAYLIGSGGTSRQAVGLGLAVTVAHTLGVLALAGITLAASAVLPPEDLYPILGVASGGLVIVIGASLLWSRLRAMGHRADPGHRPGHDHGHPHEHGHVHPHDHGDPHEDGHGHPHPAPADGVSWRGMVALGLSGGLVPSASALILLLGSIAAGHVAYGLVLVLGFGLGMAVVLTGIGLALVHARRLVERRPGTARLRRLAVPAQLATASLVVVLGVVLTGQALTQVL